MFKDGKRYNAIGPFLKEYFGQRIAKAAINAGFTCPNRDGLVSAGGCTFCSADGSGYFACDDDVSIRAQIDEQIPVMRAKWPDAGFIAYFQSFTNTYAPVERLRKLYEKALSHKDIRGIAIATRPDCLPEPVLDLLEELNRRTFLWVELGLQTANDATASAFNRGYSLETYDRAVDALTKRGIRTVTHLIFGLPGETPSDMLNTVRHICRKNIFGIKFHLLTYMSGTLMGSEFLRDPSRFRPLTRDEYVEILCDALEVIPPDITIHRLTGDAPEDRLIAPRWALDKLAVLNAINRELKKRDRCQGDLSEMSSDF
ncbi:MAG: TIGR01212 family radical SAM protein [Clostridia bacterium]|nr:TIGR01212 family radical SAM protein [Clostridia bacterium]